MVESDLVEKTDGKSCSQRNYGSSAKDEARKGNWIIRCMEMIFASGEIVVRMMITMDLCQHVLDQCFLTFFDGDPIFNPDRSWRPKLLLLPVYHSSKLYSNGIVKENILY